MKYVFYRSGNPILDAVVSIAVLAAGIGLMIFLLPFMLSFIGIIIALALGVVAWNWIKVKFFGAPETSRSWGADSSAAGRTIFRESEYYRERSSASQPKVQGSWKTGAEDAEVVGKKED